MYKTLDFVPCTAKKILSLSLSLSLSLFSGSTGFESGALALTRQALYYLSHVPSPKKVLFSLKLFSKRELSIILLGTPDAERGCNSEDH
jgi:hypothetical protein